MLAADVLKRFENQSVEDLDARPEIMQPNPVEVRNEQHEPEEAIVEYPDGAPPELIREMKEPDDSLALPRPILKRSAEAPRPSSGLKLARQGPISKSRPGPSARGPVTVVDSPPSVTLVDSPPPVENSRGGALRIFPKTPGCPSCDSGMEAPGIRHSAQCKRKRAEFDRQNREQDTNMEENPEPTSNSRARVATEAESEAPNPPSFPTEITATDVRGQKRESEQPAEELEAEIKDGHDDMELDCVGLDLNWSCNGDPVLSPIQLEVYGQKAPATAPEFFDDLVSSIKFSPDKKHTFFTSPCVEARCIGG